MLNRIRHTSLALGLLMLVYLCVGSLRVGAQSTELPVGNGFRISPVRSELVVDKGKSQTFTINVENPSSKDITAQPIVNNFLAGDDESGSPRLVLDESVLPPKNDFKRLVQPLDKFTVPAQGNVNVQVTISVPSDANAGGYYGAIRFVPLLPGLDDDNVALTASVGTIVLLQVPGDLTKKLDLVQFSAAEGDKARGFFIGGDVSVLTRLRNTGDIHVQPFGKVQVSDFFGNVVHEYEFNNLDPRSNILPDSTRKFIDDIPQRSWFGRYTVTTSLGFSQGSGDLINAKTTFWYFSTVVFYAMLLGLIILVAAIYTFIKRRGRGKSSRKKHPY